MDRRIPEPLQEIAARQFSIVSARQLAEAGVTRSRLRAEVAGWRWQRAFPRVYALVNGDLARVQRIWAALCYAGDGAVVSHYTAAELQCLLRPPPHLSLQSVLASPDRSPHSPLVQLEPSLGLPPGPLGRLEAELSPDSPVHIMVSNDRRVLEQPGLRIHYRSELADRTDYGTPVPVTRIEHTVLDLVEECSDLGELFNLLGRACNYCGTDKARLRDAWATRPRSRWRRPLLDLLADVSGLHFRQRTPIERIYRYQVERAHTLPRAQQLYGPGQKLEPSQRINVHYGVASLVVEVDGEVGRLPDDYENKLAARTPRVHRPHRLRFDYPTIAGDPCTVARSVVALLGIPPCPPTGRCYRRNCRVPVFGEWPPTYSPNWLR